MGRHASTEGRRRGVAAWPIVTAVAAVVVVATLLVYFLVLNREDRADSGCDTTEVLQIVTSPGTAEPVSAAAVAWMAKSPIARAVCFTATVTVGDNVVTTTALVAAGDTWTDASLPAPAVWVIDDEAELLAVDSRQSALTAGRSSTPVASSPVVLAMAAAPATVPSWADLAVPSGTTLVLPTGPGSGQSALEATESIVAGAIGTSAALSTQDVTANAALIASLAAHLDDRPLTELLSSDNGAVAVQESLLFAHNLATPTAAPVAVHPTGPTASAEVYSVPLVAPWATPAQRDAATQFHAFLVGDGLQFFADAGFRVEGKTATTPAPGVELSAPITALPNTDSPARLALVTALATETPPVSSAPETSTTTSAPPTRTPEVPASPETTPSPESSAAPPPLQTGPTVALILDSSTALDNEVDDQSLTTWVAQSVTGLAQARPDAGMGIWTCGAAADSVATPVVAPGPLQGEIDGIGRTAAVEAAMAALAPNGANHTYGCLNELWPALTTVETPEGQQRIVVLITAGVDRTPELSRATLLATVAAASGARLEIIGLTGAVNGDAMAAIAAAGGGSYQRVAPADLAQTLLALVG